MYSMRRERLETNFLRPRFEETVGGVTHKYKGLINISDNKGAICWGVVDAEDNFIAENLQMLYSPWSGVRLAPDVGTLRAAIREG